jgi:putative transcriptional regulator
VIDGVVAVNLEADPAMVAAFIAQPRVFVGYAGWGAGQLEAEIDEGAWLIADASAGDVFDPEPSTLWARVMRRQPGRLKLLSSFPDDPRMN